MTRIPYSPATDATPRDSDLDPHAHCRAREAALRTALAAADRLAEACIGRMYTGWIRSATISCCLICNADLGASAKSHMHCSGEHEPNCAVAAYLAAREETR